MNFKNLIQLFDYFKDENVCREYLEQQRWNGNVECPFCGCTKVYRTNRGFKCADKFCAKKFTVTVGTIYENSKIPLRTWFAAIYLATSSKKGISSLQLSRQLGITQKSAWFVLHRIREMLREKAAHMLANTVEVDECYIGGKNSNKRLSKRKVAVAGRSKTKTAVFGLVEREGKVIAKVIPDTSKATLIGNMVNTVEKGSTIVTDELPTYKSLKEHSYTHVVISHQNDEYVVGEFHTNTLEGFWSILKRGIYGIYHQVSPKHLQRYCDEFAARYNTRGVKDNERFEAFVKSSECRLKYDQLIGK